MIYENCSAMGHVGAILVNIDGHRTWGRLRKAGRM